MNTTTSSRPWDLYSTHMCKLSGGLHFLLGGPEKGWLVVWSGVLKNDVEKQLFRNIGRLCVPKNPPSMHQIADHDHLIPGHQSVDRVMDPRVAHVCGNGQLVLGPKSCWNLLELINDFLVCLGSSESGC